MPGSRLQLPGTASLSGVTNGDVTEAVVYGSALTGNNRKAEPRK